MGSYTMRIEEIIDLLAMNKAYDRKTKIEYARKEIFPADYPIFHQGYKKVFETNILRTFYMREIGFETPERFFFELETWLDVNMPYFNRLFESELLEFDPLENTRTTTTHNKKNDMTQADELDRTRNDQFTGNTDSNRTSVLDQTDQTSAQSNVDTTQSESTQSDREGTKDNTNFTRNLETDTPDDRLAITTEDGSGVIEYASKIGETSDKGQESTTDSETGTRNGESSEDATSSSTTNTDATTTDQQEVDTTETRNETENQTLDKEINSIEDFVQQVHGKIGTQTYSEMVTHYRETFLRIEREIHKELNQLFMLVY